MLRKIFLLLPFLLIQPALAAGREVQDGFFKTSDGVKLHVTFGYEAARRSTSACPPVES